jgi:site-specific DNA recombinase
MRCAIYCRLSQDRSGKSPNIEIQRAECADYAAQKGWEIVGTFSDDDISASRYSTKARPGYGALLSSIRTGEVDVVLVTEMPRLYRRLEELLELLHLAEQTPLRGIETSDGAGYELSTGQGVHAAVTAVSTAMLESRKLSDRLKRIEVVRWLNDGGIPTTEGKQWRTSTIRRLLSRKRLIAIRTHNGAEYPATWPAILDVDTFERVNLILKAEARGHNAGNVYGRSYLLTGTIVCGRCGAPLVGFANRHRAAEPTKRRYFCKRSDDHGAPHGCAGTSRLAEPVETLVAEAVLDVLDSPRMAELLGAAATDQEMAGLVEQYQVGRMKLDDLIADYASGLLNRQQLAQAKTIVEAAMEATSRRMEQLQSGRALGSIPVGQSLREAWAGASLEWRRQLVALVVEKVILHPSSTRPPLWREWNFDPSKVEIRWRV